TKAYIVEEFTSRCFAHCFFSCEEDVGLSEDCRSGLCGRHRKAKQYTGNFAGWHAINRDFSACRAVLSRRGERRDLGRPGGSGAGGRQDLNGVEPGFDAPGPGGDRLRGPAEAITVSTLSIDVQFGGDLGALEREEVDDGVFNVHRIVLGLEDERGRGFVRDVDIRVRREVLGGERWVA